MGGGRSEGVAFPPEGNCRPAPPCRGQSARQRALPGVTGHGRRNDAAGRTDRRSVPAGDVEGTSGAGVESAGRRRSGTVGSSKPGRVYGQRLSQPGPAPAVVRDHGGAGSRTAAPIGGGDPPAATVARPPADFEKCQSAPLRPDRIGTHRDHRHPCGPGSEPGKTDPGRIRKPACRAQKLMISSAEENHIVLVAVSVRMTTRTSTPVPLPAGRSCPNQPVPPAGPPFSPDRKSGRS